MEIEMHEMNLSTQNQTHFKMVDCERTDKREKKNQTKSIFELEVLGML